MRSNHGQVISNVDEPGSEKGVYKGLCESSIFPYMESEAEMFRPAAFDESKQRMNANKATYVGLWVRLC